MTEYQVKEIKEIIEKHWSEMMSELDNYVNTDYLDINIKLRYDEFDEGFELELREAKF